MSRRVAIDGVRCEEPVYGSTALDSCIFGMDEDERQATCYELPSARQKELRQQFISDSLEHHLSVCPAYRAFAARVGAELEAPFDIDKVALVPTASFKQGGVLSVRPNQVDKWCRSSGTLGKPSVVGRDRITLERMLGTIRAGLGLIDCWYEHELSVINLGPDRLESGDLWFAYLMSLVELSFTTIHEVVDGRIDYARCVADLKRALDESPQVGIVGPPFYLIEMIGFIRERKIRIDGGERLSVLTAGGWKRAKGLIVPRLQLEERMSDAFKISSASQYRDAFNQVELNTVLFECSAHRKHLPPWVYARARDARTLSPLHNGEQGLLSFLDASATSYPAFIIGDDVGEVQEGACACGREGLAVRIDRRVEGRDARGCALTMDR
jgi:long-chain-fatty-acid---luciferin-component ligase